MPSFGTFVTYDARAVEIEHLRPIKDSNGNVIGGRRMTDLYGKGTSVPSLRFVKLTEDTSPYTTIALVHLITKEELVCFTDNPDSLDVGNTLNGTNNMADVWNLARNDFYAF
jgi:hypothetical protein